MARVNLLEGKESSVIVKLATPMVLGLLSVIGVSLVDAYFVGKIGTNELVAFGFIFPVMFTFNGVILGIGSGASTRVAKAVGSGNILQAKRILTDALLLGVSLVIVLSVIGKLTIDPVFTMLGATHETLPLIRDFMHIWYSGAVLVTFPMISVAVLVAIGNTQVSSRLQMSVMLGNIIFDPIFAFGFLFIPAMGFCGIAVAMLISRIFVLFYALYVLIKKEKMVTFERLTIGRLLLSWKDILYIGLPNAGTNIIMPVGFGIITRMAAGFGKEAVAAIAVAERVETIAQIILLALANSMGAFVGQNSGAGNVQRIRTGTRKVMQFSFYWGGIMLVGLYFFADRLILLFNTDPKVIEIFTSYFHIMAFGYVMVGNIFIVQSILNAFIMPFHASMLVITRIFILYVPFAIMLSSIMGINGIFCAGLIANVLTGFVSIIVFRRQSKKVFSAMQ